MSTKTTIATAVIAGLVGIGIGVATENPKVETRTVQSKPETVEKTVEVEKKVEVVPDICLKALDSAEGLISLGGEGMSAAGDALFAASEFDIDGLEAANEEINRLSAKVDESPYAGQATRCRAKAK